jgi:hypothetical protein
MACMDSVHEYLARMHLLLQESYAPPDTEERKECLDVAFDAALRMPGRSFIVCYTDGFWPRTNLFVGKLLMPVMYEVDWYAHVVCREGDLLYDPIFGEPVPVGEYSQLLFRKEVRSFVLHDARRTEDLLWDKVLFDRVFRCRNGLDSPSEKFLEE